MPMAMALMDYRLRHRELERIDGEATAAMGIRYPWY
jgi:hypothetical protein